MSSYMLEDELIKLGSEEPNLRPQIRSIISQIRRERGKIAPCLDEEELEDDRMHDILGVDPNLTIEEGYGGGPDAAAQELADSIGYNEALAMCNCACGSSKDDFICGMKQALQDMAEE